MPPIISLFSCVAQCSIIQLVWGEVCVGGVKDEAVSNLQDDCVNVI